MYSCYLCKEHKTKEEFCKDKSRKTGISSKCKDCMKLRNKEKLKTEEGKKKRTILSRRWKRANRIKENAHKAVARAIKANKLDKPTTCFKCSNNDKIEGHHPDYTKPLDVVWLCKPCHIDHHRKAYYATR